MRTSLLLLPALMGCGQAAYTYSGYWASDHFPLTPSTAEFMNEGDDFDFSMEVSVGEVETSGGTKVATFNYMNKNDDNSLLYKIKWSSDNTDGIQVHGYYLDDGWVNFSSPVQIVERQGEPNTSVTSDVDGSSYTATFEAYEACPNLWNKNWECMKVVISSDEDNPAPFLGTWHWATEYGTSRFQPVGTDYPWILEAHDWD